ncbi:RNA polymerase sigma factor SigJ [Streptomyces sp. Da 82-17]|uniref:RNA polymerase sigma factor SigJ n=1 Tax=Streptomyces sp. Da 82-17 TaxID=3377116 RepID=UPI0038D447E6
MTDQPEQQLAPPEADLDAIVGERRRLTGLAYRLLGSLAEAEDAVQETYARWYALSRPQQDAVESPGAWLTTVATRVCLDLLGSARVRRERYVGEWIPEPLPARADRAEWLDGRPGSATSGASGSADPADRVTLDESVSMAFLVVLESLTPAQRVALVLHDVFGFPFAEIAGITGRTPAACRELASAARRRIRASLTAPETPAAQQARLVRKFKRAWDAQDIDALVGLLAPGATFTADGGGVVAAVLHPIEGAEGIARHLTDLSARASGGLTVAERTVNGRAGLVLQYGGEIAAVYAFEVAGSRVVGSQVAGSQVVDEGRITRIWAVRNPAKLRSWAGS